MRAPLPVSNSEGFYRLLISKLAEQGFLSPSSLLTMRRMLSTLRRPFRVLGIQQVAIGGLDKSQLSAFWGPQGLLGIPQVGSFRSEVQYTPHSTSKSDEMKTENVDEELLRLGIGPLAVEIDLMTPIDASKVKLPPMNLL